MKKLHAAQTVMLAITALGLSQSAASQDVCDDFGQPVELTFQYVPSTQLNTNQPVPGKADIIVNDGIDDDGISFVVVSSASSNPLSGTVFFQGTVSFLELFVASGGFTSTAYIYFFDDVGDSDPLQQVKYHTSCSAPIELGDQVLSATLVGYVGENGEASIEIPIDIKPGSDPNSIAPFDRGVIPVAILTTEDFDALTVDEDSVLFGPAEAEKAHKRAHVEDVDGDGDLDLLLHFRTQDTGIAPGDTEACLIGQTYDGVPIMSCDSVNTVPPN